MEQNKKILQLKNLDKKERMGSALEEILSLKEKGVFYMLYDNNYSQYTIADAPYGFPYWRREVSCSLPVMDYRCGTEEFITEVLKEKNCLGIISLTDNIDKILEKLYP